MRYTQLVMGMALAVGAGLATAAKPAEGELVRIWRDHPSMVTVQDGPVPGVVVLTSQLTTFNPSSMNGNSGGHMGQCTTLVHEVVLKRDLKKEPLRKDEILGFSCTTDE